MAVFTVIKNEMDIKNIAIIAHVDHGKTSLVDQLLTQSGTMKKMENQTLIMDSNDQEKERGITIYAKNTSIMYKNTTINIVDTPWHADFGSEVERALKIVDSVLLVVDAYEGPMPQTKFVLKKSLEQWLYPLVVINKIDKPTARPHRVVDQLFDLFFQLWASDEQANFPVIYTSARDGYAFLDLKDQKNVAEKKDMTPLLDFIVEKVPSSPQNNHKPFRMQVVNLGYDNFVWRLGVGRVTDGTIKTGEEVVVFDNHGVSRKWKISKLYTTLWLQKKEVNQIQSGEIATIAGISDIYIGETVGKEGIQPLSPIKIDEPTLMMDFLVNDSPFAGKEGKYVTSRNIVDRLLKECETNVGLDVTIHEWGKRCTVSWRGELHLSVLIESMRREWFELQVSSPNVIFKEHEWNIQEPIEHVVISVADELAGTVIEMLSNRKWMMKNMFAENGITTIEFDVPTRWLLGVRAAFVLLTKGEWIMYSAFSHYENFKGEIKKRTNGSMISAVSGKAMKYSIWKLQERGVIFVEPQTELYEGMIVGESAKPWDMWVNLIKNKHQSNVRSSSNDENMLLQPIKTLSLEDALSYIGPDEYVEITPKNIRIRKIYLTESARKAAEKNK